MKDIVAGSRSITDYNLAAVVITKAHNVWREPITELVSGKANGVDLLGERWANENSIPIAPFPADWKNLNAPGAVIKHGKYGLYNARAGFDRNEDMALYADRLIAIWNGISNGTKDMIDRAKAHGLHICIYNARLDTYTFINNC